MFSQGRMNKKAGRLPAKADTIVAEGFTTENTESTLS